MATFVATSGPPPTATPAMSNHLVMSTSTSFHHHHRHKAGSFYSAFPPSSQSTSLSAFDDLLNRRGQSPPTKMTSTLASTSSSTGVQRKLSKGESIHSGHFMVSEIEETEVDQQPPSNLSGSSSKKSPETESDYEGSGMHSQFDEGMTEMSGQNSSAQLLRSSSSFQVDPFQSNSNENSQLSNSHFYAGRSAVGGSGSGGSVSVVQFDSSLTKLFESMRLAYSGKITSPKWKAFKGLKLHIKDKIRLNNIIWRAWHIQYIAGRNPVVCQFSSSADSKRHKRTEAILLEGKYWKRRVDAVQEEYKKWRLYHRKGHGPQTPSRPSDFDWELSLPRWSNNLSNLDSLFSCEESGDFFSPNYINAQNSFGNYYDYNSREIARSGMGAQFMQPGLEQLQPNVDFMDTFEPLHEAISRYHNNFALPTVQEESTAFDANSKEQEDLFNSLFSQATDGATSASVVQQLESTQGSQDDLLSKPMMETEENVVVVGGSSYSSSSQLFQTHSDHHQMLNSLKQQQQQQSMDSSNSAVNLMQQQQQQQSQQINYGELDLSTGNNNNASNSFATSFQSASTQQQQVNSNLLGNLQQQSSMGMQQQQQQFSSNLMSISNHSIRSQSDQQSSNFLSRYQEQPQSVNIFQPEPAMMTMAYSGQDSGQDKSGKGKYNFGPYYSTGGNQQQQQAGSGRSRSRSISMPHGPKGPALHPSSQTIKSLLTKPSLVSTMGGQPLSADNSGVGGGGTLITSSSIFRVPTASEQHFSSSSTSASSNQLRSGNGMERSISLPVYSQERHRKLGIGGQGNSGSMMLLQRLQSQQQQQQQQQNSANLFEMSSGGGGFLNQQQQQQLSTTTVGATTFFPSTMNSGSGGSSSSQQPQYSNQETQQQQQQQLLLPQQTSSSQVQQQQQMPQIRKVSQTSVDYIGKVLPDGTSQFGGNSLVSFGGSNPNLMSNLITTGGGQQQGLSLFSPHHASNSSSSSSPIGSLQDGGGKVNITFNSAGGTPLTFTLGNQQAFLSNQQHQLQQQQQQQQQSSPFGLLNKSASSRFKSSSLTDFKDHTQLELGSSSKPASRSLAKKAAHLFGSVDFSATTVASSTSSSAKEKSSSLLLSEGSSNLQQQPNQFLSSTAVASQPASNDPLTLSPRDAAASQIFSFRPSPFTSPCPSASSPGAAGSLSPVSSSALLSLVSGSGNSGKSEDRVLYRERRRVCHINAEQKRRCNIKNGFDTLRSLLPSLSASSAATKVSKAAMLQKAAEYIRQLESEKYDQEKEYEALRAKVESLNQTISVFQNQLPATGAPVLGQRSSQIKEQYGEYVHSRTMINWKFWVFSIIMESLLDSYCNTVATSNYEEMCKTLLRWLDQSCCLITLRRDVSNSLRFISTSTNILTSPEALPEEALLAVTKSTGNKGGGGGSGSCSKEAEDERVRKYSNR